MAEMLAGMDREAGGDLAKRVSAVYEFIFRSLVKAGHRHDEKSLGDAIRILEIERETWRQVCTSLPRIRCVVATNATMPSRTSCILPATTRTCSSQPGGFSVEA